MNIVPHIFLWLLWVVFLILPDRTLAIESTYIPKPRLLILTDVGADPDDLQSLRRLLLYANDFKLEGFIVSAAGNQQNTTLSINTPLVHEVLADYAKDYNNLQQHAKGYPKPSELMARVYEGEVNVGVGNLKPGRTTKGAAHIIETVDASDEVLNIAIWGGSHDLAQALINIKNTRTTHELDKFISKLRVYAIADQYPNGYDMGTGEWILKNFPNIFFVESGPGWRATISSGFRGMYQNDSKGGGHPTLPLVEDGVDHLGNEIWLKENVINKGPLGNSFPIVDQNPKSDRNTKGIKEGDTPSWFYFLPMGLGDPEHPEWGGWGGRFEHVANRHFIDTQDNHWSGSADGALGRKWTVARWRRHYQNDFSARMDWCIKSYNEANHNPIVEIDGSKGKEVVYRNVEPGGSLVLSAESSTDPDGDNLQFRWWIYQEPSTTYAWLRDNEKSKVMVTVPRPAPPGEIHLVLEVRDNGSPNLFGYRRAIIKVGR